MDNLTQHINYSAFGYQYLGYYLGSTNQNFQPVQDAAKGTGSPWSSNSVSLSQRSFSSSLGSLPAGVAPGHSRQARRWCSSRTRLTATWSCPATPSGAFPRVTPIRLGAGRSFGA